MTTPQEIARFLSDLDGRRERLLNLIGDDGAGRDALAGEIHELAEQLIVADEELRVQSEELADARRRIERLDAAGTLEHSSSQAGVLTDDRGVVLETNRAADQLLMRSVMQLKPRPIATWFAVADRAAIRSLISALRAGAPEATTGSASISRPDGTTVPVAVSVVADPGREPPVLRWQLNELADSAAPVLQLVRPPVAEPEPQLVCELADFAAALALLPTVDAVLEATRDAALHLIPETDQVTIGLTERSTDAPTSRPERASVLSVSLPQLLPRQPKATLTLSADAPGSFDEHTTRIATALATHAGVALARVINESQLRTAIERRQHIGEAVGVLVERHKITPGAAFEQLVQVSNSRNIKVRDLAQAILDAGQDPPRSAPS